MRSRVTDQDRDNRLAAGWALANIGDAGSGDLLLKAADKENTQYHAQPRDRCRHGHPDRARGQRADQYQTLQDSRKCPERERVAFIKTGESVLEREEHKR